MNEDEKKEYLADCQRAAEVAKDFVRLTNESRTKWSGKVKELMELIQSDEEYRNLVSETQSPINELRKLLYPNVCHCKTEDEDKG